MEIALTALGVLVAVLGLYWRVRVNEQKHVTDRMDRIEERMENNAQRLEKKIDDYIRDHTRIHLEQGGSHGS